MLQLLEVLITFIGVILVMALAAQSVQEIIKAMFTIKGQTSLRALRGLIVEAAQSKGFSEQVGNVIVAKVVERLRGLGQDGVRPKAIRLDSLSKEDLRQIIQCVPTCEVDAIKALDDKLGQDKLDKIAEQAEKWYDLAMSPVGDRYRRRMRVYALISSAIIVLGLNADALGIFRQASTDPEYRKAVTATVSSLNDREKVRRQLSDSLTAAETAEDTTTTTATLPAAGVRQAQDTAVVDTATASDSAVAPTVTAPDSARIRIFRDSIAAIDSINKSQIDSIMGGQAGFVVGDPGKWRTGEVDWYIGIIISILLVSLGAPFWHDLLEALFGLKNRIRAQAENVTALTKPEVIKKIP